MHCNFCIVGVGLRLIVHGFGEVTILISSFAIFFSVIDYLIVINIQTVFTYRVIGFRKRIQ